MEEIIREGLWICPNCSVKNKGSHMNCSGCGAIRGDVEFIYDENADAITDETEKKQALAGPDWVCAYCEVSNSAGVTICKGCSGQRAEGKKREIKEVFPPSNAARKPSPGAPQPGYSFHKPQLQGIVSPAKPIPAFAKFGCCGFFLFFVFLMCLEMMNFPQTLEIINRNWQRSVDIQQYQTILHGDWRDRVPTDGRILTTTSKVRSYKQVLTGYKSVTESYSVQEKTGSRRVKSGVTNLGNGRFKETYREEPTYSTRHKTRTVQKPVYRSDPIYDTWASFNLDEWVHVEKPLASGTEAEPVWPDKGLPSTPPNKVGNMRWNNRWEQYEVTFQSLKDKTEYTTQEINDKPLSYDLFRIFTKGSRWECIISGLGNLKTVKIPPEKMTPPIINTPAAR